MTKQQSFIFFSYAFDEKGKPHKLKNAEVAQELKNEGLAWVHLDGNCPNSKKWLEREVSYLDHLIIDALLANETRPRIMEFDTGMLIILRGVNLNCDSKVEELVSVRLWVDESRIISIQKRNFSAAFNVAEKLEGGKKIKNSGEFLYNFMYETLNLIADSVDDFASKMDEVENKAVDNIYDANLRETIVSIRRNAMVFKRHMIPQKEVILHLKTNENDWIEDWARRHFQENHDKICHLIEEIDEASQRSQIVHSEISNSIADRLNKSMFKISLVASIFMPLGFVAGLFGMNVGGIPYSTDPEGFTTIVAMMCGVIVATIWMFRRRKLV